MAEYDWLDTEEFKNEVRKRVEQVAQEQGLDLDGTVPFYLTSIYLERHKLESASVELIKEASQRRSRSDALRSVDVLVKEAASISKRRGSNTIESKDMSRAYDAKFCMIWPFCGKG